MNLKRFFESNEDRANRIMTEFISNAFGTVQHQMNIPPLSSLTNTSYVT